MRGAYELAERVRRNPADGDALTELALYLDQHARAHEELAPLVEQALDWLELGEELGDEPDDGLGLEPQACRACSSGGAGHDITKTTCQAGLLRLP